MNPSRFALACSVSLALGIACQAKDATPKAQTKGKPAVANAKPGVAPTEPAGPPAPATPTTPEAAPAPAPAPAPEPAAGNDLGRQFADPTWFRKTIFGDGATVLDTKRSQADPQGKFSSLIRFELQDKNVEQCAEHLQTLIAGDIPEVQRDEKDGRIQLTGSTDAYTITFMCGEAKGKTIAYVSYAWT